MRWKAYLFTLNPWIKKNTGVLKLINTPTHIKELDTFALDLIEIVRFISYRKVSNNIQRHIHKLKVLVRSWLRKIVRITYVK